MQNRFEISKIHSHASAFLPLPEILIGLSPNSTSALQYLAPGLKGGLFRVVDDNKTRETEYRAHLVLDHGEHRLKQRAGD